MNHVLFLPNPSSTEKYKQKLMVIINRGWKSKLAEGEVKVWELRMLGLTKKQNLETLSTPFFSLSLKLLITLRIHTPKKLNNWNKIQVEEQLGKLIGKNGRKFRYQMLGLNSGRKNNFAERRARHFSDFFWTRKFEELKHLKNLWFKVENFGL
jgi:hypothetical protein